jgi:uncharacterized coiled-coil DUF342 family protein
MATKEAYRNKLEAQLNEWDAKLDHLDAKVQKAAADARINYENEVESLKKQRAAARTKLDELATQGEGAWEDMKVGIEKAWDELSKAIDSVTARFK